MRDAALFLDRDGVIIEEVNYLAEVEQVRLIPGAAQAIAALNEAGLPVIVVTNQAGVARGYFTENRVTEVHERLDELLRDQGAMIDGYYVCPHHPDAAVLPYRIACACRKPRPGMLLRAARERNLDLVNSFLVGDKASDLAAAGAAGCKSVLVRTGHGSKVEVNNAEPGWKLVRVAANLSEAVAFLLPEMTALRRRQSA